jgi:ribonuclease P protein component
MAGNRPAGAGARAGNGDSNGWLKKRSDFLNAAKGVRAHHFAFVLQSAKSKRDSSETCEGARFGLTVSKKNGNSVVRNRIKRRFRAALAQARGDSGACPADVSSAGSRMNVLAGYDYVIVARPVALGAPFHKLVEGLRKTAEKIYTGTGNRRDAGKSLSTIRVSGSGKEDASQQEAGAGERLLKS